MRVRAKIQKWGNGLGLRVSGIVRDIPHFKENTVVDLDINDHGFTVTKIEDIHPSFVLPFSESELLVDMTPEKAHADILANPKNGEF
jgi:antitoxin MazE